MQRLWERDYIPIYRELLNFGSQAVNLGHGLRHLQDKHKFDLFQC